MHFRLSIVAISAAAVTVMLAGAPDAAAQWQTGDYPTVWTGVYTADQAARGQVEYETNCAGCHSSDLDPMNPDARFMGRPFMQRWREYRLASFFEFIRKTMPRRDPGSLAEETYVDIVSHVLQMNEFPTGEEELTADAMLEIQVEQETGPEPVPSGALVQVVGCLTRDPYGAWILSRASEPARTDSSNGSTQEELSVARETDLGRYTFWLQSIDYLGENFSPTSHQGQKMQTKGYVIRQPNRERIDITSMEMIGGACEQ